MGVPYTFSIPYFPGLLRDTWVQSNILSIVDGDQYQLCFNTEPKNLDFEKLSSE